MEDQDIVTCAILLYLRRRRRRRRFCRRVWVHDILRGREQKGEFHRLVQELRLDAERFQRYFRLDREQFDSLLSKIGPLISVQQTNYRRPIPPAERLAICLRFLATGDSYRTIAYSYRVGVSTVQGVVNQVTRAIWDALVEEFLPVPSTEDWRRIAEGFQHGGPFPTASAPLTASMWSSRLPPTRVPCSIIIRGPTPSCSWRWWIRSTASVWWMWGAMEGQVMAVSWPSPPLARSCWMGPLACHKMLCSRVRSVWDHCRSSLWQMKHSRCGATSCAHFQGGSLAATESSISGCPMQG